MARNRIPRRDFIKLSAAVGTVGAAASIGVPGLRGTGLFGADSAFALGGPGLAAAPGLGQSLPLVGDGWIPTCCNMCGGTTGVLAHVVAGVVKKVEPNSDNPIGVCNISTDFYSLKASGARMCPKGNAGIASLYDPDRVKRPLRRKAGTARGAGLWDEISYETAVAEIAARLAAIKTSAGPEKLVWFSEDNSFGAIQESFCNVFGTPNFLVHSNLCDVSRKFGFEKTMGVGRPLADLKNTKYMLIFGWNPLGAMKWAHLPRILLDGLANGARLVVVDPRLSETAEKAFDFAVQGRWLSIKPGTDGALALALANVIISENLYDKAFVADWTSGFAEFKAHVAAKTPDWAAAITGIPAATIRTVARELAGTKPAVVDAWSGPGHHTNGAEASRAVAALAGLIGQVDRPGTLIVPDRKGPKFAVPALTGTVPPRVDGRGTKYPFAHSSGIYVEARDAMLSGVPYKPKAAVFVFQNFVFSVPNTRKNIDALNQLDLVVSVDTMLSETAMMADYVIPGSHYLERYELLPQWVTFPVVALRQPAVSPIFGQKVEYEFVKDLAIAMGYGAQSPFNITYEQFMDDALKAGVGITLNDLKALPGATWIGGNTRYEKYEASGFATPSRKFEFFSSAIAATGRNGLPDYTPPVDTPNADYPLHLVNWKEALHTHSRTMNNRQLMEFHGENELWINTSRASALGIKDGDLVWVENPNAKARAKARVTNRIRADVVGMTHGFGHSALGPIARGKGTNDGQFVPGKAEALTGMAVHKEAAVKVYK